jgi:SAM-dependent methyltransferase
MRDELLEVLAEPGTGARLRLEHAVREGDEISEGDLVSEQTGRRFKIVRGIPRFVEGANYTDSFGLQWNRYRGVQLDSLNGRSYSRDRFDAETGWDERRLRDRWVLDGGCGAGRFAEVAATRGPRLVALDFSSAIEATAETVRRFDNVHPVQGNLLEPPFRPGTFDFVYSIGVVQHTPDPRKVVHNLVEMTRQGGEFCLTIYARRPWTKLNAKYLIRPITSRLPQERLLAAIEAAMPVVFPVTDGLFRLPMLGPLARFLIPVANYVEKADFTRQQRYDEAVLDTFDMLAPKFDQPMTAAEVEAELHALDARAWTFNTRVPINVVGVR